MGVVRARATNDLGAGGASRDRVIPIERDGKYALRVGETYFEVDPAVGGRITQFSARGHNVLMPLDNLGDWTNGGSTFWTSPQASWGWPPPETLDRHRYRSAVDGSSIVLTSQAVRIGAATLRITKRFWADPGDEAVNVSYTVTNRGDPVTLAGWEISRVAATGVTFYSGAPPVALGGLNLPHTEQAQGVVWMDHAVQGAEGKLGANAGLGFVAYASPSLLFVKTFEDVAPGDAAAGEAPIELYVKPGEYVEIEQQSAARALETSDSLTYALKWYIRPMRADVQVAAGSESLLAFAKETAGVP